MQSQYIHSRNPWDPSTHVKSHERGALSRIRFIDSLARKCASMEATHNNPEEWADFIENNASNSSGASCLNRYWSTDFFLTINSTFEFRNNTWFWFIAKRHTHIFRSRAFFHNKEVDLHGLVADLQTTHSKSRPRAIFGNQFPSKLHENLIRVTT
jgi:hypothetical protein